MTSLKKFLHFWAVAFFPSRCPYCNRVIDDSECACKRCRKQIPEYCWKTYAAGGYICAAALPYKDAYSKAIHKLKFKNRTDLAKPLAMQIVRAVKELYGDLHFDLVTCVPMHKINRKLRGYNQAELLARECAELLELPYLGTLEKFKQNQPQHETSKDEREKNVRGVYRLLGNTDLSGKRVLLIDDVITTGHTLGECSRILMKGKCAEICCAVVCVASVNKFIAPG